MPPTDDAGAARATTLIHQGWNQLKLQQPLAAWGSWQRALRVAPDFPAAREALTRLESAVDLPSAARSTYRFMPPDPSRRSCWDDRFQGRDLGALEEAAAAFESLTRDDPTDAPAWFNSGLCLAWLGRNIEAVASLDRATHLLADPAFDLAVEAWALAEVLRLGAGAETLADDLNASWTIAWSDRDTVRLLVGRPELQRLPNPRDVSSGEVAFPETHIFEWLDRPMPEIEAFEPSFANVPRVLASVVIVPGSLRLSSPDPRSLEDVHETLIEAIGDRSRPIRREIAPLAMPLLDAAVWMFRLPRGIEPETEATIARSAVEHYYETRWIHVPRQGLGGLTPLEASQAARAGDPVARARLTAVVRLREQLSARPRTADLYQGYPFDRLRRRLGLEIENPEALETDDLACASGDDLDALDPTALDDIRLVEAYESASTLNDDSRTARFAAAIVRRDCRALSRLSAPALFAPMVREAMSSGDPAEALRWLDRARTRNAGRDRRTFDVWTAEIHARTGDFEAAATVYQSLVDEFPHDARLALDAAETLLDNGALEPARPFLDAARRSNDRAIAERAEALLAGRQG